MQPLMTLVQRSAICLIMLALGYVAPTLANPQNYPQFAQHEVDPAIPIAFVKPEEVKQRLEAGRPQILVDVRSWKEYAAGHVPGAVSIPLEVLTVRMTEIPPDIPVVLY